MAIKTFNDLVRTMLATVQSMQPYANLTTGTFQRDVLIDAPAGELAELYGEVRIAQEAQSIRDASGEHLDRLLANYAIYRKPGDKSTGTVWFQRSTAPMSDVTVAAGTRIRTSTTTSQDAIEFVVTASTIMLASQADSYYNVDTDLYEINAPVQTAYSGSSGNVGPNTIIVIAGLQGITNCTNKTATTGGTDLEVDSIFRARGLSVITGTNAGTKTGYEILVESQYGVYQCSVVDPDDPEMERVADGGGVDIWVKTEQTAEVTDTYAYPPGELYRVLLNRPVISISAVRENGTLLVPGIDYGAALDRNVYERSVYANDRIWWITPRTPSATIAVTYVWCNLIQSLQDMLDADVYHHAGADVLAKICYKATVDITLTVEIYSGYTPSSVTAAVNSAIVAHLGGKMLGMDVQQSDIVAIAEGISGVDSVVIPFTTFQVTRERTGIVDRPDEIDGVRQPFTTGNLLMRRLEYADIGTIVVNYYT